MSGYLCTTFYPYDHEVATTTYCIDNQITSRLHSPYCTSYPNFYENGRFITTTAEDFDITFRESESHTDYSNELCFNSNFGIMCTEHRSIQISGVDGITNGKREECDIHSLLYWTLKRSARVFAQSNSIKQATNLQLLSAFTENIYNGFSNLYKYAQNLSISTAITIHKTGLELFGCLFEGLATNFTAYTSKKDDIYTDQILDKFLFMCTIISCTWILRGAQHLYSGYSNKKSSRIPKEKNVYSNDEQYSDSSSSRTSKEENNIIRNRFKRTKLARYRIAKFKGENYSPASESVSIKESTIHHNNESSRVLQSLPNLPTRGSELEGNNVETNKQTIGKTNALYSILNADFPGQPGSSHGQPNRIPIQQIGASANNGDSLQKFPFLVGESPKENVVGGNFMQLGRISRTDTKLTMDQEPIPQSIIINSSSALDPDENFIKTLTVNNGSLRNNSRSTQPEKPITTSIGFATKNFISTLKVSVMRTDSTWEQVGHYTLTKSGIIAPTHVYELTIDATQWKLTSHNGKEHKYDYPFSVFYSIPVNKSDFTLLKIPPNFGSILAIKPANILDPSIGTPVYLRTHNNETDNAYKGNLIRAIGHFHVLHTATTYPGYSGAPLCDAKGNIYAMHLGSRTDSEYNYAVVLAPFLKNYDMESPALNDKFYKRYERLEDLIIAHNYGEIEWELRGNKVVAEIDGDYFEHEFEKIDRELEDNVDFDNTEQLLDYFNDQEEYPMLSTKGVPKGTYKRAANKTMRPVSKHVETLVNQKIIDKTKDFQQAPPLGASIQREWKTITPIALTKEQYHKMRLVTSNPPSYRDWIAHFKSSQIVNSKLPHSSKIKELDSKQLVKSKSTTSQQKNQNNPISQQQLPNSLNSPIGLGLQEGLVQSSEVSSSNQEHITMCDLLQWLKSLESSPKSKTAIQIQNYLATLKLKDLGKQ
jgi:hypothetical protein